MADYQDSLTTIRAILSDPAAFRLGQPQWKSPAEFDRYLKTKGFRLTNAQAMGPSGLPDGQQLIYEGPSNVIVKIKTRGYNDNGPPQRVGVATMSIEATNGRSTEWADALFKVDGKGKIIAKSITSANEEVLPLPPDHPDILRAKAAGRPAWEWPKWGVKNPKDSKLRAITRFEVIEGGANPKPINRQAWDDAGHLNFAKDFDPKGADKLAASIGR